MIHIACTHNERVALVLNPREVENLCWRITMIFTAMGLLGDLSVPWKMPIGTILGCCCGLVISLVLLIGLMLFELMFNCGKYVYMKYIIYQRSRVLKFNYQLVYYTISDARQKFRTRGRKWKLFLDGKRYHPTSDIYVFEPKSS